ncbi:actin-like protein arp8 [Tilletia horrida]|nr:actin-like protein arp8 [Tilletia horrida]
MPSRKKKGGAAAKWVLQPNPPPDATQELPLAYTTFYVPPPINVKNQTSSYLKSEGQTWLARAAAAPSKRRKLDPSAGDAAAAVPGSAKGKAPIRADAELDVEDEELETEEDLAAQHANTIIIHPGSQYLRIGRATDLFPVSVPNVIARKERPTPYELQRRAQQGRGPSANGGGGTAFPSPSQNGNAIAGPSGSSVIAAAAADAMQVDGEGQAEYGDGEEGSDRAAGQNGNGKKKDPLTEKIDVLRGDLRSIMRTNKLRPVTNGRGLTAQYNEGVKPERIPDHNDVYRSDWTDGDSPPEKSFYIGEAALQLPDFSVPAAQEAAHQASLAATWSEPHWRLFRPFKRGLLNHDAYAQVYGPETGLQPLLTDVEKIWTHALTAAPEDPTKPNESGTVDYGLGIPRSQWRNCNAILIVPDLYSRTDIRLLIDLILGPMGFAAVSVQSEGVAATFGAGVSSACIVDIGLERIGIACIEEGLVLPETRITLDYGGADLTTFFEVLLHRSNMPYRELNGAKRITDNILAESLKERLCTLNPADLGLNICDFLLSLPKQPTLKFMLRTYDEVILCPMALFNPRVVDFDAKSGWRSVEASGGKAGGEDAEDFSVVLGVPELRDHDPVVTLAMQHCCRHLLAPPAPVPIATPAGGDAASATGPLGGSGAPSLSVDTAGLSAIPSPNTAFGTVPGTAAASRSGTPGIPASSPAVERSFMLGGSAGADGGLGASISTQASGGPTASASATPAPPPPPPAGPVLDIPREASKMPLDIAVWASIVASGSSTGGQLTNVGINTVGGLAGEDRIKKMSSNVIVTGGTAQIPGLGIALELRINQHFSDWLAGITAAAQAAAQAHFQATGQHALPITSGTGSATATLPNNLQARTTVVPPQRDIDPRLLPWKGMSVFARLECASDLWLRAEDWTMLGWRAAKDKV